MVPWWGITSMTPSTLYGSVRGFMICSLDLGIRINPLRLLRRPLESTRVTKAYTKWTVAKEVRDRDHQREKEKVAPHPTLSHEPVCHSMDYSGVIPVIKDVLESSVFARLGERTGVRDRLGPRVEEPPARDHLASAVVVPERKDDAETSRDVKRRWK
ncbi:hypothetical protein RND81_11G091600 [Saponaria officinalis]|uniref:Uncharacterized protein n=1 Tax=Saponaria officinalis TaxID=3572 RepID=A0AAW1HJS9_SAPOF